MQTIGKGTKFMFSIGVTGLGEMSLADNDVNFKVDFYARQKKDSIVTGHYTVRKSDQDKAFPNQEDENSYFVICDTTGLDLGTVCATLEIEYTDEDTGARLKELIPLTSQVAIIDAPQAPDGNGAQNE